MTKNYFPMAFFLHRRKAIIQFQHDPFLSGNIAPRDVITIISRKAISSLAGYLPLFFHSWGSFAGAGNAVSSFQEQHSLSFKHNHSGTLYPDLFAQGHFLLSMF